MRVSLTTSRAACARRKYRGSLVCFKKVSKISRASSGKCSLRVRMRRVSIIKYYKNIKILCQTTGFPSYQNKTFPPQISQELLDIWNPTISTSPIGNAKGDEKRERQISSMSDMPMTL